VDTDAERLFAGICLAVFLGVLVGFTLAANGVKL
jgi:hypothetical protein